jgi:hypothetical protein
MLTCIRNLQEGMMHIYPLFQECLADSCLEVHAARNSHQMTERRTVVKPKKENAGSRLPGGIGTQR